MRNIRKIVIPLNRHVGIGDIVLSTGFVYTISKKQPQIEIICLVKELHQYLFQNFPSNVKVVVYNNRVWVNNDLPLIKKICSYLSFLNYSLIKHILLMRKQKIDLMVTNRSGTIDFLFMWLYGAKFRLGFPTRYGKFFLTHRIERVYEKQHIGLEWQQLFEYLTGNKVTIKPTIFAENLMFIKYKNELINDNKLHPNKTTILIHTGASTPVRKWDINNFCEVVNTITKNYDVNIIWFCDYVENKVVLEKCNPDSTIFNYDKPLSFLIEAIRASDIFLGNDSGPMHIAGALDKEVIALFGPMLVELYGPYTNKSHVIQNDVCHFRPCFDKCKYAEPICMKSITTIQVYNNLTAVLSMLEKKTIQEERKC